MYSDEAKNYAQAKEEELENIEIRFHEEDDNRGEDREPFMRDYARVLYSSSFRRLQGKMQLLGVDSKKFYRNRLTHSLEVAQIAKSIAAGLGIKKVAVVETAALAHDIGNPPFGHCGERVLNDLGHSCGGYEGNAQTLRILRVLEKKHPEWAGLNLNIRTFLATVKYFNTRGPVGKQMKKFLYDDDYDFLKNQLEEFKIPLRKSIDAEIMDLADEIAYAAHDLEDALSSGLVTINEITHEFDIDDNYHDAHGKIVQIAHDSRKVAQKAILSSEEYFIVLKKEITSRIVNILCRDIDLVDGGLDYKEHKKLAYGLKELLFKAILRKKDIQHYECMGENVLTGLFQVYTDEKFNKDNKLLPAELRNLLYCKTRLVLDYISGMMDSFAIQEYERYYGKGSAEKLYRKND